MLELGHSTVNPLLAGIRFAPAGLCPIDTGIVRRFSFEHTLPPASMSCTFGCVAKGIPAGTESGTSSIISSKDGNPALTAKVEEVQDFPPSNVLFVLSKKNSFSLPFFDPPTC